MPMIFTTRHRPDDRDGRRQINAGQNELVDIDDFIGNGRQIPASGTTYIPGHAPRNLFHGAAIASPIDRTYFGSVPSWLTSSKTDTKRSTNERRVSMLPITAILIQPAVVDGSSADRPDKRPSSPESPLGDGLADQFADGAFKRALSKIASGCVVKMPQSSRRIKRPVRGQQTHCSSLLKFSL